MLSTLLNRFVWTHRWPCIAVTFYFAASLVALAQSNVGSTLRRSISPGTLGGGGAPGSYVAINGIPVNLYRGVAYPGFSLAALQGKDLSVPVALGYDGQGVRVTSTAGEVGTGWGISAGGDISCEVVDEPDASRTSSLDWLRTLQTKPSNGAESAYQRQICEKGASEYGDTEYDVFRLNVNGIQARFLIKDQVVHVLDNPRVTIEPSFSSSTSNAVLGFVVKDFSGNVYNFAQNQSESTRVRTTSSRPGYTAPVHEVNYTSRWKLSSIESANHEVFNFTYMLGTGPTETTTHTTNYQTLTLNGTPLTSQQKSQYGDQVTYTTTTQVALLLRHRLQRIECPLGKIEFTYGLSRADAIDNALTAVVVTGIDQRVLLQTRLHYSYFMPSGATSTTVPTAANSRLRLDKIIQTSEGCSANITRFTYQQSGDVGRQTNRQDYYGFYNNNTATTLLAPVPGQPQLGSGNRNPDLTSMMNCALTRIDYGIGGYTTLEYELHQVGGELPEYAGSGLRIKRITAYEGSGASLSEELTYTIPPPRLTPLCHDFRQFRLSNFYFPDDPCEPGAIDVLVCLFRSSAPIGQQVDDLYGYPEILVTHTNHSKSRYQFTSNTSHPDTYNTTSTKLRVHETNTSNGGPCWTSSQVPQSFRRPLSCIDPMAHTFRGLYPALPESERPYGVRNDRSVYRGNLLELRELAADGVSAFRKTEYEYNYPTFSEAHTALSVRVGFEQDYSGGGGVIYNWYYNLKYYTRSQAWTQLRTQRVTVYDQNNAAFSSTTGAKTSVTEYQYNFDSSHSNCTPSDIVTYDADTPTKRTISHVSYPGDYDMFLYIGGTVPIPGTFLAELVQRNMLDVVVEEYVEERNPGITNTIRNAANYSFRLENNRVLPDQVFKWAACGTGNCTFSQMWVDFTTTPATIVKDPAYRLVSTTTRYDAVGNLLNTASSDGLTRAQVWGYGASVPIAQVVNATVGSADASLPATAGHTSFEFENTTDGWSPVAHYSSTPKTGARSTRLSKPVAEYGPSKKFVLTPVQQHGKYVFTCWAKTDISTTSSYMMAVVGLQGLTNDQWLVSSATGNDAWYGVGYPLTPAQGWVLCKATVDFDDPNVRAALPANQSIRMLCGTWLTGANPILVDEYRVRPDGARMTTKTYLPGVGVSSETDANDVTTYYEYDDNHRLSLMRDEQGNIIKRVAYHQANDQVALTLTVTTTNPYFIRDEPVYFSAEVSECGTAEYSWNFDDVALVGSAATQKGTATPTHTFVQAGSYVVRVVADTPGGGPVQQSITINVVNPLGADIASLQGNEIYDVCQGTNPRPEVMLQAIPLGGCAANHTYQWETRFRMTSSASWGPWQDVPNGTSDTLRRSHDTVGVVECRCRITDACGRTATTDVITVRTEKTDPSCPDF